MSAVLESVPHTPAPAPHVEPRTIKIGLLGLGQVGQAVARLTIDATRLRDAGYRLRIVSALVRHIDKPRRCVKPARVTTNPSAFLRGHYDVVVEALGTVEPARSIVSRLLGRGVPVVTANKALVAAHGQELTRLALRRGTTFRYEASALAGVPFLGAFSARPLVSDVRQFAAVVNGTSNFILSKLDIEQCTFAAALQQAQALGLTEPDASRDVDGLDAADKLTLLACVFGWGTLAARDLEVQSIRELTPRDFAVARSLDATVKPVVYAMRDAATVHAFVGPALVRTSHPLAPLGGALSGIQLSGTFIPNLFFSGPGAGPEITAATILDDVVEAVRTVPPAARAVRASVASSPTTPVVGAPDSEWLLRITFPGVVPSADTVARLLAAHALTALRVTDAIDATRWAQVAPIGRATLETALERLRATHRVQTFAIRVL